MRNRMRYTDRHQFHLGIERELYEWLHCEADRQKTSLAYLVHHILKEKQQESKSLNQILRKIISEKK